MFGAIAGDIIGSPYEHWPIKREDFPLFTERSNFTDDSVLTVAVAYAILHKKDYGESIQLFARNYPRRGYGGKFYKWIFDEKRKPYNSWGNGSAMRVSPVGYAFDSVEDVLKEAKKTAEITHNHPEGIKGAQATALAIFYARLGKDKDFIRSEIAERFGYDLNRTVEEVREHYKFEVSCQKTVPEAIIAFLDSKNFEDAIRKAVSLGGDSDTVACITGSIAEAFYREIPEDIVVGVKRIISAELWEILRDFYKHYAPDLKLKFFGEC